MSASKPSASVDKYTTSIEAEILREFQIPTVDEISFAIESEFVSHLDFDFSIDGFGVVPNEQHDTPARERKVRAANAYPYQFGNVYEANWYALFLQNSVCERAYFLLSRDRFGEFKCSF
jgi:hypothetical protein